MRLSAIAAILVGCLVGCRAPKAVVAPEVAVAPPVVAITHDDLVPEAGPGESAVLSVGGVAVPVKIIRTFKAELLTLDLIAFDQSFEREVYVVKPNEFGLRHAGFESLEPALPLLKFPMKVGDSWTWKGTMTSGVSKVADASITSRADKVSRTDGGQDDAVLVEVNLKMDGGGAKPAERHLAFWFVKNKGVIKREIGSGSSRAPAKA